MIKKKVTYTDFDGNERTEDFYFNLTTAEITEMEMSVDGGLGVMLQKIIDAKDGKRIINMFKELVLKSYGIKSDDGKRFIKNDEVRDAFVQTQAYSDIFMSLATDDNAASEFVKGILPKDIANQVEKMSESEMKAAQNRYLGNAGHAQNQGHQIQ